MLADFGISKSLRLAEKSSTTTIPCRGTTSYLAPEFHGPGSPTKLNHEALLSADVWSAGVVVFQIMSDGLHPYDRGAGDMFRKKLGDKNPFTIHHQPVTLLGFQNELAKNVVLPMLAREPKRRPSIDTVRTHPYFQSAESWLNFLREFTEIMGCRKIDVPRELKEKYEEGAALVFTDAEEYRDNEEVFSTLDWRTRLSPKAQRLYVALNEHALRERKKSRDKDENGFFHVVNTYKIDSVLGLARFFRNFDQHHVQYPEHCREIFGREHPSPEDVVDFINAQFSRFFVHTFTRPRLHEVGRAGRGGGLEGKSTGRRVRRGGYGSSAGSAAAPRQGD